MCKAECESDTVILTRTETLQQKRKQDKNFKTNKKDKRAKRFFYQIKQN